MNHAEKILIVAQGAGLAGAESYALSLLEEVVASNRECSLASFHHGLLGQRAGQLGIEVVYLEGTNNLASMARLRQMVRKSGCRLVHFVDLKSATIGALALLGCRPRSRTFATLHGLPEFYRNPIRQTKYLCSLGLYFLMVRFVIDGIICVSFDIARRMKPLIGTRKTQVIHNGVRLPEAEFSPEHSSGTMVVGTVGRLEKVKGHRYLLEAMRPVLSQWPDMVLKIIGDGPLRGRLMRQARELGVDRQVEFLGFREDARNLIRDMDIFVLPSLHEGIPYVLLEAMAFGKPVICSNVGGIREVIQPQIDGILIPPREPQILASHILTLLRDSSMRSALGSAARHKVATRFSAGIMAKRTMLAYEAQGGDTFSGSGVFPSERMPVTGTNDE